jgi:hypothetical protein
MCNATWVSRHETVEQGAYPNCYLSKKICCGQLVPQKPWFFFEGKKLHKW